MTAPLPSFIVIGAIKAATTWIHNQLQENPAIYLPDPEPHFFSTEFDRGLDFYRTYFAEAQPGQLVGEKSADYLGHPDAARRIAEILPEAALVVQLRNPVERAYSDYCMLYRRGTVRGRPEEYFDRATTSQPRFLDDGLYARHLSRWLDLFDRSRIHVLLFEDVKQRPRETVEAVCDHIGAPRHFATSIERQRINDGSAKFLPLPIRTALAPLKGTVAPLRQNSVFRGVRSLFAREVRYPPLSPDARARLQDFYADDVQQLSAMLGRDLDHWLTPQRVAA